MIDKLLNLNDAIAYIQQGINRTITQVHIHNTFSPSHKDFTGNNHLQLQANMRNYHINSNGWQDIGQHLTLFPDGMFVTGRDLNIDPASIKGWNTGAICIEMLGDFNGTDPFQGAQAESSFRIVAALVKRFGLSWDAVKFHRDNPAAMNPTCPGTSIDKGWFITESQARYQWMYSNATDETAPQESSDNNPEWVRDLCRQGIQMQYFEDHLEVRKGEGPWKILKFEI